MELVKDEKNKTKVLRSALREYGFIPGENYGQ